MSKFFSEWLRGQPLERQREIRKDCKKWEKSQPVLMHDALQDAFNETLEGWGEKRGRMVFSINSCRAVQNAEIEKVLQSED